MGIPKKIFHRKEYESIYILNPDSCFGAGNDCSKARMEAGSKLKHCPSNPGRNCRGLDYCSSIRTVRRVWIQEMLAVKSRGLLERPDIVNGSRKKEEFRVNQIF